MKWIYRSVRSSLWLCLLLLPVQGKSEEAAKMFQAASSEQYRLPEGNVLEDENWLLHAGKSLGKRPEFAGKEVYVFEKIHFFNGVRPRIELAVLLPHNADRVQFYLYENGKWRDNGWEQAVSGSLKGHTFALSKVDFRQVSDIAAKWRNKAKQLNAVETEPYYVAYVFLPKRKKYFWHTATLEAFGAQYYLSFHENGSVWEDKRLSGRSANSDN